MIDHLLNHHVIPIRSHEFGENLCCVMYTLLTGESKLFFFIFHTSPPSPGFDKTRYKKSTQNVLIYSKFRRHRCSETHNLLNAEKVSVLNFDVDLCTVTTTYECTIFETFQCNTGCKNKRLFSFVSNRSKSPTLRMFPGGWRDLEAGAVGGMILG